MVLGDPLGGECHLVRSSAQILRVPKSLFPLDCGLSMWQHGHMSNLLCWKLGEEAGLLGKKPLQILMVWFKFLFSRIGNYCICEK